MKNMNNGPSPCTQQDVTIDANGRIQVGKAKPIKGTGSTVDADSYKQAKMDARKMEMLEQMKKKSRKMWFRTRAYELRSRRTFGSSPTKLAQKFFYPL